MRALGREAEVPTWSDPATDLGPKLCPNVASINPKQLPTCTTCATCPSYIGYTVKNNFGSDSDFLKMKPSEEERSDSGGKLTLAGV